MKKITLSILSFAALAVAQVATKPIDVIAYSPYRDGQSPENGIQPTVAQIREDFEIIRTYAKGIRTYSTLGIYDTIPGLAKQYGLEVWLGAWIGRDEAANQEQIKALIEQATSYKSTIKGLIVGNEVLERGDKSATDLLPYIRQVKAANTGIDVTTSDNHNPMIANSAVLAREIDFVMTHIHPYWDGLNIDGSAAYVVGRWNKVKEKYPGKRVIVSETGYPSAGAQRKNDKGDWVGGIPSLANQTKVTVDLLNASQKEGMMVMLFSAFDEKWKIEKAKESEDGLVGTSWGLWRSDRTKKSVVDKLLELEPVAIMTPDRKLRVIPAADAALGGIDALGRLRLPSAMTGAPAKALPVWTISRP